MENHTLYREKNPVKRWLNRQFLDLDIFGVEVTVPRLRWSPLVAFALIVAYDSLILAFVAMSDVASDSSPEMLVTPKIIAWFAGLI